MVRGYAGFSMRRTGSFLGVLLIASLLTGGAGTSGAVGKPSVPTVKSLLGKRFVSVRVTGKPAIGQRKLRISFLRSPSGPSIRINAGCNIWVSGFTIRNGRFFRRGQVSGTKIGCTNDPDPWLRRKLRQGMLIRSNGRWLILARPAERIRFVLTRVTPSGDDDDADDPDDGPDEEDDEGPDED